MKPTVVGFHADACDLCNYLIAEKLFYHRHMPCCESLDEDGFCGQVDDDGNPQYTLCDKPDEHFYWDDTNPTQAGWKAVMEQLEGPIKEYLDI